MIDDKKLSSIERLHKLKNDGVISEAEFEKAKADLLEGRSRTASQPFMKQWSGQLPDDEDGIGWITLPLKRYADFTGRSCRKEFWMFQLISLGLFILSLILINMGSIGFLGLVFVVLAGLGLFIPTIAVQVRRFHDQNKSGWFALFNLIPYVGPLIIAIFMLIPGTQGDNDYGPDPLAE